MVYEVDALPIDNKMNKNISLLLFVRGCMVEGWRKFEFMGYM